MTTVPNKNDCCDIYETILVCDGEDEWRTKYIWFYGNGAFSICEDDGSGDHDDIDEDEVRKLLDEADENNREYAKHVLKTNSDPASVYVVSYEKTVAANLTVYFSRWVGERSGFGLAVTTVRVLTGKHKGVYDPGELPCEISEYLMLKYLKMSGRWVIDDMTKSEIADAGECSYMGNDFFKCRVEWKERRAESSIRRQLRSIARRDLK